MNFHPEQRPPPLLEQMDIARRAQENLEQAIFTLTTKYRTPLMERMIWKTVGFFAVLAIRLKQKRIASAYQRQREIIEDIAQLKVPRVFQEQERHAGKRKSMVK